MYLIDPKLIYDMMDNSHKRGFVELYVTDVDYMPRIEAEPVRHGQWNPMRVSSGRDSWQCSLCGRRTRGKRENLPYCHCGAKMDVRDRNMDEQC